MRALLIQKDTKQISFMQTTSMCLRALLIQKDTKQKMKISHALTGLRALLIQKDTKQGQHFGHLIPQFESFANSERYKTVSITWRYYI